MHGRVGSRGHRPGHSYSGSVGQKAQLTNAYSELGNALLSTQIKTVGNYTLGRVIGEGSFGKVRLAVNKLTSQRCAIKQIPRSVAPPLLTREIHHHRRLHHPNVLRLFEVIATENSIWLITELCAGGELFDYLVEKGRLSELEAKRMFGQLCLGVGHIHQQGVVHRDLKLENILLDERCNVKIADFGFGREFEQRRLMETYCGTTGYAAPEMLAGRKYTGQEVDVWSLGVILYTLLTGSLPFDDDDEEVMKQKILAGDYDLPLWLSEDARDLISGILQQEPVQRYTIAQILGHNWFTRPYTMSPQPADYFQTFDTLPLTIPEESGSPPADTPEASKEASTSMHHLEPSTANSEASTSSYHSAASASESDFGMSNSRSGTPLTADEHQDSGNSSPRSNGKGKGVDRSGPSTLHRNTSQSTITQSESLLSLSRYSGTPMAVHQESPGTGYRFPLPSPLPTDSVPFGSPALPMQAHSRTPSRTKRRSIGSTMSERLLPKDEGPALPDYLALLSAPYPAPFSTPLESHLLESLSLLGFDTGQMIHSVRTDACDASGAIWWMLKLKAEQKELDAQEAASSLPQKSDSMNSLAQSVGRISLASQGRRTPLIGVESGTEDVHKAGDRVSEELQSRQLATQPEVSAEEPRPQMSNSVEYGGPDHAPSPRKLRLSVGAAAKMSSVSAPALSPNKPSADRPPSPPQMPNFVKNPSDPAASTLAKPSLASSETSRSSTPQTKPRSASVSTVSMLQRAGSVLGVSVGKKDKVDDGSASEARLGTGDAGRSTPSLLGSALFGRKASGTQPAEARPTLEQKLSKELLGAKPSVPDSSSSVRKDSPDLGSSTNSDGRPSTTISTPSASPARQSAALPVSTPKAESSASRSDASLASGKSIAGQSPNQNNPLRSSVASNKSTARSSKNLFSSFRHWFNDDRRKSKRYRQSSVPTLAEPIDSPSAKAGTLRKATVHAPSPLKRPPIARMPSNGPPSAAMSRRNSSTSARRIMPGDPASPLLGHSRRRSDASRNSISSINGARTPTSEKGDRGREVESRPPSSQSHLPPTTAEMYNAARKRHGRASSTSSTASRSSVMISGSPVAAYRRTPAVTQVKRLSTPKHDKHRLSQSHQNSAPSSVHDSDSRRSSMSVHAEAEDTIIEEESVTPDEVVQAERSRALRKLSGDAGQLLEAASSALAHIEPPAESGIAQSRPTGDRRPSSESFSRSNTRPSHNGHSRSSSAHGTAVFAAHRVVNPFGTPNGTHFQHHTRRSSEGQRPKLRDVFKNKKPDGEGDWLDEDEELDNYSGGFGQSTGRQSTSGASASQSSRTVGLGVSHSGRDTLAPGPSTPTPIIGEGRYAGLGVRSDDSAPSTGSPAWKGSQGARGPSFRTAATVLEEEEEEE